MEWNLNKHKCPAEKPNKDKKRKNDKNNKNRRPKKCY